MCVDSCNNVIFPVSRVCHTSVDLPSKVIVLGSDVPCATSLANDSNKICLLSCLKRHTSTNIVLSMAFKPIDAPKYWVIGCGCKWNGSETCARFTNWGWDKIVALLQTTFSMHLLQWKMWIAKYVLLTLVPNTPINNDPVFVETMILCQTGDKPFSESLVT